MVETAPAVSVIIPTHNRARLISRAIRSALEQTFQDLEVIVVDDGSTDGTEEAVKGFADPRLRFLRHGNNRGGSAARNTGIRAARGRYIAFLDSDDEWLPGKLAEQVRILDEGPECGAVYTNLFYIYADGKVQALEKSCPEGRILGSLLKSNVVGTTSSVMVRRCCFDEAGLFDETLPSCQDWDMWIRLARLYPFRSIPAPLVRYSWHEVQISKNVEAVRRGYEAIMEKYRTEIRSLGRFVEGYHHYYLGKSLCGQGEMGPGRRHLWRAAVLCPWRARYGIYAFAALLGESGFYRIRRLKQMLVGALRRRPGQTGVS